MLKAQWKNGNGLVSLYTNGTRIIDVDGEEFKPSMPLNIDIRVSTRCAFGMQPNGKSVCSFCHESARTDGIDADLSELLDVLKDVPAGTELAVGCNQFTDELINFFSVSNSRGHVVNITVNQGMLLRDKGVILQLVSSNTVNGVGISYRPHARAIPDEIAELPNAVLHVIAGIDNFSDVVAMSSGKVKKILVLGEKDFGFNSGNVDLTSISHIEWYRKVRTLFDMFDVVSFDNLALEQLKVKRFLPPNVWETVYQHEHSFYINAVDRYSSPSSRSPLRTRWDDMPVAQYFQTVVL